MEFDKKYKFSETWFDIAIQGWSQIFPQIKHEIKNVQNTLDNIKLKLKDYVDVNLIGDKGYITKKKFIKI